MELLPLLLKWLSKRKFSVQEQALDNAIILKVEEMFAFTLQQHQTTATDLIQTLEHVKEERQELMRDQCLFSYFVVNRGKTTIDASRIVESPLSLYSQKLGKYSKGYLAF